MSRWVQVEDDRQHFHYHDDEDDLVLGCVVVDWVMDEESQCLVSRLSFSAETPADAQQEFADALQKAVSEAGGKLAYARVGAHDDRLN